MMNSVPSVPIDDFENTLSFPSEETSLGSGIPSHLPSGDVQCPSIPSHGFLHHTIGTLNSAMRVQTITSLQMLILCLKMRKSKRICGIIWLFKED
jgi:hypothetical protein